MQDLRLSRKFASGFGAVLVAVAILCTMTILCGRRASEATAIVTRNLRAVDALDRMQAGMFDQNASIRGLALYKLPRYVDKYRAAGALARKALAAARQNSADDSQALDALTAVEAAATAWQTEIGDRAVTLGSDAATVPDAITLTASERASVLINLYRHACDAALTVLEAASARAEADGAAASRLLEQSVVGGASLAVGAVLAAFFWLRGSVVRPIVGITAVMGRLARGDLKAVIPRLASRDELGEMARAVQVFRQAAIDKAQVEHTAEDTRRRLESEREGADRIRAASARQLADVVEEIGHGLDQLAQGALAFRLDRPFPPEYEKLRADFNAAIARLAGTLATVSQTTSSIRSGTSEISTAADDLSRRTEHQAARLEETAAALDDVTTKLRRTADGANHARTVANTAKVEVERSGAVMRDAVDAMGGIERSSDQIGRIIGLIEEIAFQTNLLALNAGVEAARAGDAGRGFAVVASEVRALAQRSAEAAKEIGALIEASRAEVGRGAALVGQTGEALGSIVGRVAELNEIISEIAAAADDQAAGLNQINTAINQMDRMTQENAAMVEQSTAASRALAHESQELATLVGWFRLENGASRSRALAA